MTITTKMSDQETRKPYPCETAWGTKKELAWIENIGDTVNKSLENPTNQPKTNFLQGYINACKIRNNWGEGANKIDKKLCLKRAQELLGQLRNGY